MPTYGIPPYMIGRNVTIQITPQDISSGGVLSNNAIGALTCNGRLEQDDQELAYVTDNISPRDAFNTNPVAYEVGSTFTITEIAQAWALWTSASAVYGQGNTLEKCARISTIHLVQITCLANDLTSQLFSWTGYCLMDSHRRTSPKAKNTYTATFRTVIIADTSTGDFASNPGVA